MKQCTIYDPPEYTETVEHWTRETDADGDQMGAVIEQLLNNTHYNKANLDVIADKVATKLLAKNQVINNLLATEAGNVLDACQGKTLMDLIDQLSNDITAKIYPIGSIYITANEGNPSIIFGGEWELIPDRFLIGAGKTYPLGSTGGRSAANLDIPNLPIEAAIRTDHRASSAFAGGNSVSDGVWSVHRMNDDSWYTNNYGKPFSVLNPYLAVYIWKRVG